MEVLLMVVIFHALCFYQGLQGAAISSNKNGADTSRGDELVEKQSTEGGPHIPSLFGDCSGSLLALHHGSWVAITLREQRTETKKDMGQHCKHIDCEGVVADNGTVSMNTCLSDCTIINSNLYNCTETAPDNCSNVIEVVCAWQAVQLIGGNDRCAGRVELFGAGGWGSVCDDGWDLEGGDVVCAQLGCGTASWVMGQGGGFGPGSGPIHISQLNCSGAERNLWQCATELDGGRNYCGHKEDAAVVCSGSSYIPTTTMNTFMTNLTNWTSETVTVAAAEDNSDRISAPVLGCIVLSVTLLLLLFLNAAQCAYYKRQNGGPETWRASQASQQNNSDTSSDSDYEHYFNPDPPPQTAVNNCENAPVLDSESTFSVGFYDKTETETKKAVDQFYPEHCIKMTPFHNTSEPHKSDSVTDSFDSDSTSSGECYMNTEVNAETCLQTSHALDSESTSSGECYENTGPETENLLNPAVDQFYPEHCIQMTPLHNTSEIAKSAADSFDSDSTSSGECYENVGVNAEPCLQTLEGNPSVPEQPLLGHPLHQMAGNSIVSNPCSTNKDDSSTSSEEAYENLAVIEENSSSDSDYDDVSNW